MSYSHLGSVDAGLYGEDKGGFDWANLEKAIKHIAETNDASMDSLILYPEEDLFGHFRLLVIGSRRAEQH